MLKNKFIRFLIILNGILLPIVIGFIIYAFVDDFLRQSQYKSNDNIFKADYEEEQKDYSIANNGPQKLYNSDIWYIIFYRYYDDDDEFKYYGNNDFPKDILNIVFLDKELNVKRTLLNRESLIINVSAPNKYSEENRLGKLKEMIFYLVVEEDTNSNGYLDRKDFSCLFASDLDGNNFRRIIEKDVNGYRFINENLISVAYMENGKIKYGVYDFLNNEFKDSKSLNEIINKY
ncbi:hypothetical protein [Hyunsoonleella pacifica]|uniref:EF-hand domain-containing protein n=1 Tax=Hyunsoonleella pacifica TaxID=1080224 RepID=A0A4Q9FTI0_9FLAO|nr:hypothetical protein [Hyunsoonleella pacifica]TBN17602.1 hypothetical protein EYD46_04615 [Hyunsoonleella pacifica]GGD10491.1 hypothetical protein GCM10011368_10620 [Hyunsoonleella pacifica]